MPNERANEGGPAAPESPTYQLRVHVPVTLSILVPVVVDVPGEEPTDLPVEEGGGVPMLDLADRDDAEAIATAALAAAAAAPEMSEASDALALAVQFYRRGRPEGAALFTPFLGLVPEESI